MTVNCNVRKENIDLIFTEHLPRDRCAKHFKTTPTRIGNSTPLTYEETE